jgi:hypothetical protein
MIKPSYIREFAIFFSVSTPNKKQQNPGTVKQFKDTDYLLHKVFPFVNRVAFIMESMWQDWMKEKKVPVSERPQMSPTKEGWNQFSIAVLLRVYLML